MNRFFKNFAISLLEMFGLCAALAAVLGLCALPFLFLSPGWAMGVLVAVLILGFTALDASSRLD